MRDWSISKLLKISVNPDFCDKKLRNSKGSMSHGFEPYEVTLDEFCNLINVGFAFSYQFKNSHRRKTNFICTDFIGLDMDGGREIEDLLNDPIVKKYGSIFYTTASHTPDHHRLRIIFVLPRTITDVKEVEFATRSLARRLGGDPKVADGARMFYGSESSEPRLLGNSMTKNYLNELIIDGKVDPKPQRSSHNNAYTTNRSKLLLDLEQEVKTSKNIWVTFERYYRKNFHLLPLPP